MKERRIFGLSRNVFFLGVVSLFQDISGEMVFTILPLFLTNVLQAAVPVVGYVEGVAESSSSLLKVVSGWVSDRTGKRKGLAVLGYGLSVAVKPFMYFVTAWGAVLGVRFVDRVGKGVRTSPRDALIADSVRPEERGKSFGFHRGMDTMGAVIGLAVAALIVFFAEHHAPQLTRNAYRLLVIGGIVPGVLGVLVLLFFVRERKKDPPAAKSAPAQSASPATAKSKFDARFKIYLAIMVIFSLGNSSDAFLVLRAQNLGHSVVGILVMLLVFNITYAVISMPAGMVSDRLGRRRVMVAGWGIYALVYLGFAMVSSAWLVWLLFAVYGIYYGMSEGVGRALVADLVAADRRGTAYGYYHAFVGISLLPASIIAGWLWLKVSPAAPFYFGAGLAGLAAIMLWVVFRKQG